MAAGAGPCNRLLFFVVFSFFHGFTISFIVSFRLLRFYFEIIFFTGPCSCSSRRSSGSRGTWTWPSAWHCAPAWARKAWTSWYYVSVGEGSRGNVISIITLYDPSSSNRFVSGCGDFQCPRTIHQIPIAQDSDLIHGHAIFASTHANRHRKAVLRKQTDKPQPLARSVPAGGAGARVAFSGASLRSRSRRGSAGTSTWGPPRRSSWPLGPPPALLGGRSFEPQMASPVNQLLPVYTYIYIYT